MSNDPKPAPPPGTDGVGVGAWVLEHLAGRVRAGALDLALEHATVTILTGGVSGDTVLVEAGGQRVVVKRALGRLRVRNEWLAKPERALTEAAAIELLHRITPDQTPQLLDIDPETYTLVMLSADPRWTPWKSRLLAEPAQADVEIRVGEALGALLGTWHRTTSGDTGLVGHFDDDEAFEQLRVGPFHRTVAGIHPVVAAAVETCIGDLETRRDCLVHGDFSPKNVLVGPADAAGPGGREGLMVLDFEVAHRGAAVFDAAYMQCHLLLKATHRPNHRGLFRGVAEAFLAAYTLHYGASPEPRLVWHTACLLLARVDGVSPSGYLTEQGEARVRELALSTLQRQDATMDELWDAATDRPERPVR